MLYHFELRYCWDPFLKKKNDFHLSEMLVVFIARGFWFIITFFPFNQAVFCQQDITVYNSWDFESELLGPYTREEIIEDFNDPENIVYTAPVGIVNDVINGQITKVMRMTHWANDLWHGFGMNVRLDDYDEIYVSYNWKFSEEYNSTAGAKLPGFVGLPTDPEMGPECPRSGYGFAAHNMHKRAGRMISYHYDRTDHNFVECPWSTDDYNFNEVYFNNGCWYNITQRLVMNTFTNGNPNSDGIKELWVDGRMIFQETNLILMENESETMKIDGFRLANYYGGNTDGYRPLYECYGYIDNIKIYLPSGTEITGHELHSPSEVLTTPDEITDRRVYYDELITSPGNLRNSDYGSNYGNCIDEAYLIDAGEGNSITFKWGHNIGTGDYLFFYDGNTTDASLLRMIGSSNQTTQTIKSTGRYLFVRFSTDRDGNATGWNGTITFHTNGVPNTPSNLQLTQIDSAHIMFMWKDNSGDEEGFEIQRGNNVLNFSVLDTADSDQVLYEDDNVLPETEYYYRIRAYNTNGYSNYSNILIATTSSSIANYALGSISDNCYSSGFLCVPLIRTQNDLVNVIGIDAMMVFDRNMVIPTGLLYVSNDMIENPEFTSYAMRVQNDTIFITVFLNVSAPINTSFNGTGELFCVEFIRTPDFEPNSATTFQMPVMTESYLSGTTTESVQMGSYSVYSEEKFIGKLRFWADNSPMYYDESDPDSYAVINITSNITGSPVVNPGMDGNFIWNIVSGTTILIDKDIPALMPGTSEPVDVQPVINAMDAYLASRVVLNDPYKPEVQQVIAMDVNRDQVISAGDISQINQRTVSARDEFAQVDRGGIPVASPSKDWLFLDQEEVLTNPLYRRSTSWPYDDSKGYSKERVPFPVQEFDIPVEYFEADDCPIIYEKIYQAILLGDADGSYKNYNTPGTGLKDALNDSKIVFKVVKSVNDVKILVSFESETQVVAMDISLFVEDEMSSYEISSAEGVCYQRGNLIKCTAYGMENDENAVISIAFDGADFEDINVQNTLINGEVVDYSIEVTDTSIEQKGVEVRKVIVYPNPAHNELNVVVIHEAEIAIYNALGYLISKDKTYNGQATFNVKGFTSGIYQVKILQEGKSIMTVPVVINNISGLRK
jgi:hypothetical protein